MDNNKEEVLEEISSVETESAKEEGVIAPDKVIKEDASDTSLQTNDNKKTDKVNSNSIKEKKEEIERIDDDLSETVTEEDNEEPPKKKAPIIILLSIFLLIDIAALVIYIIGIDKVLSFIK